MEAGDRTVPVTVATPGTACDQSAYALLEVHSTRCCEAPEGPAARQPSARPQWSRAGRGPGVGPASWRGSVFTCGPSGLGGIPGTQPCRASLRASRRLQAGFHPDRRFSSRPRTLCGDHTRSPCSHSRPGPQQDDLQQPVRSQGERSHSWTTQRFSLETGGHTQALAARSCPVTRPRDVPPRHLLTSQGFAV